MNLDERDRDFLRGVGIEIVEADDLQWQKVKNFYRECGLSYEEKDWLIYDGKIYMRSSNH